VTALAKISLTKNKHHFFNDVISDSSLHISLFFDTGKIGVEVTRHYYVRWRHFSIFLDCFNMVASTKLKIVALLVIRSI